MGESDITFVIEANGKRFGILVEDKVDAAAMPNQHDRYIKRGDKAVARGDYDNFAAFIFCPQKYFQLNTEAQKYEHFIPYEAFRDYFNSKQDPSSLLRCQQLSQAINKAKRPPKAEVNKVVNAHYVKYKEYQQANYPGLELRTKATSNGWWARYGTRLETVHLLHKIEEGYADLTFPHAAKRMDELTVLVKWLQSRGVSNAMALPTGQAGAIRIIVPRLVMREPFENTSKDDLDACFRAIELLTNFANVSACAQKLGSVRKKGAADMTGGNPNGSDNEN